MRHGDRVKETTTTTGTGNITLGGAVSQFQAFSSVYVAGQMVPYAIVGQSGTEWETGYGILIDSVTLQRLQVSKSSNSNNAVNFSAGTKDVFGTILGEQMSRLESMGHTLAKALGYDMA